MVREWRRLQKIDETTYIGECDSEHPDARVFGGHVLAQAMSAAYFTAPEGFYVHSIHCYFIRGGDEGTPIMFKVKKIRDGRNFAIRNRLISRGYDARDLRGQITERMAPVVELRPVSIDNYLKGTDGVNEKQYIWLKYKNTVALEDYMLRHASLVYLSDLGLAVTGSLCHREKRFKLMTSLDHTAWFHTYEFDINDWVLYEQKCVMNSNHRSLINGRLWSRSGQLLMSTTQEALIYKSPASKL